MTPNRNPVTMVGRMMRYPNLAGNSGARRQSLPAPLLNRMVTTVAQEGDEIAEELRQLPPGEKSGSVQGWGKMFIGLAAMPARRAGRGGFCRRRYGNSDTVLQQS
jgi:hypothetical protein